MNIERAFERRRALQERLARIERTGSATWPGSAGDCPGSVTSHDPRRNGACRWCGKKVAAAAAVSWRYEPTIDIQEVFDPVTLEPVDPHDRDGYKRPGETQPS